MPAPLTYRWLHVEQVGDAIVVRFTHTGSLSGKAVETVTEQLYRLVDEEGHTQLVLNLHHVEGMESAMVGKLLILNKKVLAAGGRLKLCQVGSALQEVFDTVQLPRLLGIYADEGEALATF